MDPLSRAPTTTLPPGSGINNINNYFNTSSKSKKNRLLNGGNGNGYNGDGYNGVNGDGYNGVNSNGYNGVGYPNSTGCQKNGYGNQKNGNTDQISTMQNSNGKSNNGKPNNHSHTMSTNFGNLSGVLNTSQNGGVPASNTKSALEFTGTGISKTPKERILEENALSTISLNLPNSRSNYNGTFNSASSLLSNQPNSNGSSANNSFVAHNSTSTNGSYPDKFDRVLQTLKRASALSPEYTKDMRRMSNNSISIPLEKLNDTSNMNSYASGQSNVSIPPEINRINSVNSNKSQSLADALTDARRLSEKNSIDIKVQLELQHNLKKSESATLRDLEREKQSVMRENASLSSVRVTFEPGMSARETEALDKLAEKLEKLPRSYTQLTSESIESLTDVPPPPPSETEGKSRSITETSKGIPSMPSYHRISPLSFKNLYTSSTMKCLIIGGREYNAQLLYYHSLPYFLLCNYPNNSQPISKLSKLPRFVEDSEGPSERVGHVSKTLFLQLEIDSLLEIRSGLNISGAEEYLSTSSFSPGDYIEYVNKLDDGSNKKSNFRQIWGKSRAVEDLRDIVVKERTSCIIS